MINTLSNLLLVGWVKFNNHFNKKWLFCLRKSQLNFTKYTNIKHEATGEAKDDLL